MLDLTYPALNISPGWVRANVNPINWTWVGYQYLICLPKGE